MICTAPPPSSLQGAAGQAPVITALPLSRSVSPTAMSCVMVMVEQGTVQVRAFALATAACSAAAVSAVYSSIVLSTWAGLITPCRAALVARAAAGWVRAQSRRPARCPH